MGGTEGNDTPKTILIRPPAPAATTAGQTAPAVQAPVTPKTAHFGRTDPANGTPPNPGVQTDIMGAASLEAQSFFEKLSAQQQKHTTVTTSGASTQTAYVSKTAHNPFPPTAPLTTKPATTGSLVSVPSAADSADRQCGGSTEHSGSKPLASASSSQAVFDTTCVSGASALTASSQPFIANSNATMGRVVQPIPGQQPPGVPCYPVFQYPIDPLANPTILINTIEAFSGASGTSVEDFTRAIDVSSIGHWGDAATVSIALSKLKGVALEFIQMSGRPDSWQTMKTRLHRRFGVPATDLTAFTEFVACQQKANEKVAEFAQRLNYLGTKGLPEYGNDGVQFRFFMNGLKPSVRTVVVQRSPVNYEQALEYALYYEATEANGGRQARTYTVSLVSFGADSGYRSRGGNSKNRLACHYCKKRVI